MIYYLIVSPFGGYGVDVTYRYRTEEARELGLAHLKKSGFIPKDSYEVLFDG